jgi:PAS domain S-box-containing protein
MNTSQVFKHIVENSGDAIVLSDRDGKIRIWNRGAERIFGFTEEEAIGASLDIIIPEKIRERHWEGYNKTMISGVTKYGDQILSVPALTKNGERISVDFTVILVTEGGSVSGIAAIMRDVTEKFQRERELQKRVKELEGKA